MWYYKNLSWIATCALRVVEWRASNSLVTEWAHSDCARLRENRRPSVKVLAWRTQTAGIKKTEWVILKEQPTLNWRKKRWCDFHRLRLPWSSLLIRDRHAAAVSGLGLSRTCRHHLRAESPPTSHSCLLVGWYNLWKTFLLTWSLQSKHLTAGATYQFSSFCASSPTSRSSTESKADSSCVCSPSPWSLQLSNMLSTAHRVKAEL